MLKYNDCHDGPWFVDVYRQDMCVGADPGGGLGSNPTIPGVSSFALQLPGLLTEFCTAQILNQVPLDFPEWVPCQSWVKCKASEGGVL